MILQNLFDDVLGLDDAELLKKLLRRVDVRHPTDRRPVVYAFLSAVLLVYSVLNAQRIYSEPHWLQLPLRLTK